MQCICTLKNLSQRFSDEVSQLCDLLNIFEEKSDSPDLSVSLQQELVDLGISVEKSALFPLFCRVARLLVLLPLGTATVERSFSTLNWILNSQRCRSSPEHVSQLMLLSVESQPIPDVRDAMDDDTLTTDALIGAAYSHWLKKPRK
jgi:hAT family C-terminal dimerisation region